MKNSIINSLFETACDTKLSKKPQGQLDAQCLIAITSITIFPTKILKHAQCPASFQPTVPKITDHIGQMR